MGAWWFAFLDAVRAVHGIGPTKSQGCADLAQNGIIPKKSLRRLMRLEGDCMNYAELVSIPKQWRRLERDTERVLYLRELVESLPQMQTNGRVQNGNVNRSMDLVDVLVDAERDIIARKKDMRRREQEAFQLFAVLKNPERKVMYLHYCKHMSMKAIAEAMYYTPRYCYILRDKGLNCLVENKHISL